MTASRSSPLTLCDQTSPPECCQPLTDEEWAARGERLAAARAAALSSQPKYCPRCGSDSDLAPVFGATGNFWDCMCGSFWEVQP